MILAVEVSLLLSVLSFMRDGLGKDLFLNNIYQGFVGLGDQFRCQLLV